MIKRLHASTLRAISNDWLETFNNDFQRRFLSLLSYQFAAFPIKLAVAAPHPNLIASQVRQAKAAAAAAASGDDDTTSSNSTSNGTNVMSITELQSLLTNFDLRRLESYTHNMVDYHMILDLLPLLSRLFFCQRLNGMTLSYTQCAILLGVGLQHKSISDLEKELAVPATQLLALFNKAMRKVATSLRGVEEAAVRAELPINTIGKELNRPELKQSLHADLADGARSHKKGREEKQKVLQTMNLEQFAIGGTEEEWNDATGNGAVPATVRYTFFCIHFISLSLVHFVLSS
jgi:N-acetyltransferase 10